MFFGSIEGTGNEHTISINCEDGADSNVSIDIVGKDIIYAIDETNQKISISEEKNDWKPTEMQFSIPYQSQLTNLILEDLIENKTCGLTPFAESIELHLSYLNGLDFSVEDKEYFF